MHVTRPDLEAAQAAGLLGVPQVQPLWDFLATRPAAQARFSATHVLYYFGGLIAIGAMSLFLNLAWDRLGGWGLVAITSGYAVLGLIAAEYLLFRRQLPVPAGIAATFVLMLVPLGVYGLQLALGWWPHGFSFRHGYLDGERLMIEFATLAAGAVLVWRYRVPFLLMPVAITLLGLSLEVASLLALDLDDGAAYRYHAHRWELYKLVTLWFGVAMTLLAFWIDVRSGRRKDYAFWLYLVGVPMFWCGLSLLRASGEWSRFLYFCTNLGLIAIGAVLARRVFVVFGAFGVVGYLGHLAHLFTDSLMFPVALSALGFGIVWLGVKWQRHEARFTQAVRSRLPAPLRELLENAQAG